MLRTNLKDQIIKYTNNVISIFYNIDVNLFVTKNFKKLSFFKKRKLIKRISKINIDEIIQINTWVSENNLSKKSLKILYKKLLKFHNLLKDLNLEFENFQDLFNFVKSYHIELIDSTKTSYVSESFGFTSVDKNLKYCTWLE